MGFRVVDKSSFTFTTDLPPSTRNIHPSGVLHAFRRTPPTSTLISTNAIGREEHTFAWISNSLHVDAAMTHLQKYGFDLTTGIVFIPYSTKRNWLDRYPHAAPALETTESGEVVVYLNYRPYLNGLGELTAEGSLTENYNNNDSSEFGGGEELGKKNSDNFSSAKKKRVNKSRAINILRDNAYLPDAERDELHVEVYNYLKWLHDKLSALEDKFGVKDGKKCEVAGMALKSEEGGVPSLPPLTGMDGNDEIMPDSNDDHGTNNKKAAANNRKRKNVDITPGIVVSELGTAVSKLESAFMIIPNMKLEEETKENKNNEDDDDAGDTTTTTEADQQEKNKKKDAPFLEKELSPALSQLVAAREAAGKPKRRSRKKQRKSLGDPNNPRCGHDRSPLDWDRMFGKLVEYKEEYGNTTVSKRYKDQLLANWVRGVREKWAKLVKAGKDFEIVPEGEKPFAKTLTAERVAQLNSIDFTWVIGGPKANWDDRFAELMDYYNEHGKWPTQSQGQLGLWVNKQRQKYKRREKSFMENGALKLDAVGFEWTPRGNTRLSWDDGLNLLLEFERENGHFDVPKPTGPNVDKKGDAYQLYNWVLSLQVMYRSYKLGRQSGSLTDDRVLLLVKHGFQFRED